MASPTSPKDQSANTPTATTALQQNDAPISISTEEGSRVVFAALDEAMTDHDADDVQEIAERLAELLTQSTHLESQRPALYKKYQQYISRARWMYLSFLRPEAVENLFRDSFEYFFEYDWQDVLYQMRALLRVSVPLETRDEYKAGLRKAIASSPVRLGEQSIHIAGGTQEPTVQNWLRDYRDFVHGTQPSSLVVVEYLNNNENARQLSVEDRQKLESILKFDQELLKSSTTKEGLEENEILPDPTKGTYVIFSNGETIDTGVPVPSEQLQELRAAYQLDTQGKPMDVVRYVKSSEAARTQLKKNLYAQPNVAPATTKTFIPPAPKSAKTLQTITDLVKKAEAAEQKQTAATPKKKAVVAAEPTGAPAQRIDYNDIARHVLGTHKLLFPSIEVEKRFLSIITSYLAGVRDRVEARDALSRPVEVGGANIPYKTAEQVLATADETLRLYQLQQSQHLKEKKVVASTVQRPGLEQVQQRVAEKKKAEARTTRGSKKTEPEDLFATVNPIFEGTVIPRAPALMKAPSFSQQSGKKKPVMTDIVQPRSAPQSAGMSVMGPMDELHAMNLMEFRRYGNAHTATQKIIDRLNLLEEESVTKRADGMRAWQTSALNQLYLSIGNRSLEKSIPVGSVITEMQTAGEDTLTEEEFDAIADLNQSIRF